jgi:hypothetical protein
MVGGVWGRQRGRELGWRRVESGEWTEELDVYSRASFGGGGCHGDNRRGKLPLTLSKIESV